MNGGATGQSGLYSQANGHDRHQGLVCHWINDGPHDRLQLPFPRYPSVDQVRDGGVDEENQGRQMLFMNDEIADDGGGEQAREGEDVGDRINVFMGVEGGEQARGDQWTSASNGGVRPFSNEGDGRSGAQMNPLGTGQHVGG